jgi:hypothetical protein
MMAGHGRVSMLAQFRAYFKPTAAPAIFQSAIGTSSAHLASIRWRNRSSWLEGSMLLIRAILCLVGFAIVLFISGCATTQYVPLDELLSSPERYHGKWICTEGIQVTGFEVSALGVQVRREGSAVHLAGPLIWLEGAEIVSSTDCLDSAAAPSARFCKVSVCGLFQSGGNYGHLGGYAHQLGAGDR